MIDFGLSQNTIKPEDHAVDLRLIKEILNSALKLIAKQGFQATSTRSIAKEAGVSEGLIFRYFQNKKK